MSELINHFNKFEETREQLTERTLDESPTKVKQVLNENVAKYEDLLWDLQLIISKYKQFTEQQFTHAMESAYKLEKNKK